MLSAVACAVELVSGEQDSAGQAWAPSAEKNRGASMLAGELSREDEQQRGRSLE